MITEAAYTIEAGDLVMGDYEGESPEQALDAYARDAGYADYATMVATVGGTYKSRIEPWTTFNA